MKHVDFDVVRCAVIASPGFTKVWCRSYDLFKYKQHMFGVYRFTFFFPLIGASKYVSRSVSLSLIVGCRKKTAETYY